MPSKSNDLCGALFEPASDWSAPTQFPDLSTVDRIAIDCETRDPNLKARGPGFIRGDASVAGISIATDDRSWYFPIAHLGGGNMEKLRVVEFLQEELRRPELLIVAASLSYDLEALESINVRPAGKLIDVQVAEPLIDEERDWGYSLDELCVQYLGRRKEETLLAEAADAYGVDPKAELWKLPAKYVGAYAEYDASCCLKIFDQQLVRLRRDDLQQIFELECNLLPVLHAMRQRGIPVDLDAAKALSAELKLEEDAMRLRMIKEFGMDIDVWSGQQLARACDRRKINYPRTPKGNPSFTGPWLEEYADPFIQLVADIREINRQRSTFVDGWIFENHIRGRIHPQWIQLVSEEGGTRTGRMAASNPNPQQVPAAKKRSGKPNPIGAKIRALFLSDTGKWFKGDYSQQEPRILTHFAALCGMTGADLAKMAYCKDPKMDFYQFMVDAAGINRRMAKDMYLGRCYGMGKDKLSFKLGRPVDECSKILADFDEKVPFVKEIADKCMNLAQNRGYVKTLCGRRRHFNYWEPGDAYQMRKEGHDTTPRMRPDAEEKWPKKRLVRANAHKALNALIQGSAADMMKMAIIRGYCDHGLLPYITVHDEIGGPVESDEQAALWQKTMEHCVEMCVPIRADVKVGRSWT